MTRAAAATNSHARRDDGATPPRRRATGITTDPAIDFMFTKFVDTGRGTPSK